MKVYIVCFDDCGIEAIDKVFINYESAVDYLNLTSSSIKYCNDYIIEKEVYYNALFIL